MQANPLMEGQGIRIYRNRELLAEYDFKRQIPYPLRDHLMRPTPKEGERFNIPLGNGFYGKSTPVRVVVALDNTLCIVTQNSVYDIEYYGIDINLEAIARTAQDGRK